MVTPEASEYGLARCSREAPCPQQACIPPKCTRRVCICEGAAGSQVLRFRFEERVQADHPKWGSCYAWMTRRGDNCNELLGPGQATAGLEAARRALRPFPLHVCYAVALRICSNAVSAQSLPLLGAQHLCCHAAPLQKFLRRHWHAMHSMLLPSSPRSRHLD